MSRHRISPGSGPAIAEADASAVARSGARRRAGFTLLELMISASILSIVVLGVFESLTQQHRTSIVTESVVEVQNNVRAIASLMEREVRMAGYMVPDAAAICGRDLTNASDELFVSETEPIVPDDARAGDMGARLAAGTWNNPTINAANPYASTAVTLNLDSTTTDLDGDGTYFYDNDKNGTGEADFRVDGGFIAADLANPHRGAVCGRVTAASSTQITIVPMAGALVAHNATNDADEEVVIVPAARYSVDTTGGVGRLMRNGDLLAQGVDDFQVSFYFDVDDDGVVDAATAEEPGSKTGNAYNPASWNNSTLKEIRFSIVVRTRATDDDFALGSFVTLENRTAPAGGNDGFRRRVVVGTVRPRNVGNAGSI
ncbi:prepilin-type N-terminal cleavage/methylation domain-containing protein [Myxococcota bacterium]|nr:prepilin-type N-terminal cleavage/methylation domain-containing protein [Myxococcota bacterium]